MTAKTTPQTEAALRAALADLAERWERMAGPAPDPSEGLFVDEPSPAEYARIERAATYRTAASDVRDVLRTGLIPHGLMTDAELQQHGTPEETAS
jgi:hypothetical protein